MDGLQRPQAPSFGMSSSCASSSSSALAFRSIFLPGPQLACGSTIVQAAGSLGPVTIIRYAHSCPPSLSPFTTFSGSAHHPPFVRVHASSPSHIVYDGLSLGGEHPAHVAVVPHRRSPPGIDHDDRTGALRLPTQHVLVCDLGCAGATLTWLRLGDDGPWSTFQIRIGSPEQFVSILPSTLGQETWAVSPAGCIASTDPTACQTQRGAIFNSSASKTWQDEGTFQLGLDSNLNATGDGHYGFDTVSLGFTGGPTLQHQIVAGLSAEDFFVGVFGLGPQSTNFTGYTDPQPSYLASLRNQSMIPSLSWAYSAGAQYRE